MFCFVDFMGYVLDREDWIIDGMEIWCVMECGWLVGNFVICVKVVQVLS